MKSIRNSLGLLKRTLRWRKFGKKVWAFWNERKKSHMRQETKGLKRRQHGVSYPNILSRLSLPINARSPLKRLAGFKQNTDTKHRYVRSKGARAEYGLENG